ncbi:peptidyl-tRNA hydrolase [Candidatus Woesearchaeota archaeon]|jgi:peptidyl-tRNA hydrolase, PTH2 family|nr:peptidyl-tRNA hydrolase [Candidatus Woesearchaeota archaeon]MBT7928709.1 peptidyl-tRNA hydrolase [Candidatus Peregrinibacteria bacterium]MBT4368100.1 peptidyl-tRNA hydrolase [Candidatus Woesearchaeota archaeon]MBT4712588.1 peptidyl-tRNA hydrolase [Candidatus Woesearchaeota archaeon]MBT6639501.1 peptidyl-tRNA hydrolase [Candidatus Woesearchaeota archaeon]
MELKQVILVRTDIKLSAGKMAAQVAHAAVNCVMKSDNDLVREWNSFGAKKVVLKVKNDGELHKYEQAAKDAGLKTCVISDAGLTEVPAGTETCMGIGPDKEEKIDDITSSLSVF